MVAIADCNLEFNPIRRADIACFVLT